MRAYCLLRRSIYKSRNLPEKLIHPIKMRKTRFLIMSDTHNRPPFPATDTCHPYRHPLPAADVLLHCGDLTMRGGLSEYQSTLRMLSSINAELKLVIAGNHDRSLDEEYWKYERDSRGEDEGDYVEAIEMWKGTEAMEAGVTYLEEGVHEFVLKSGASLKVSCVCAFRFRGRMVFAVAVIWS